MTGYEGLRDGAAWIDLSARGKIRVTGEDRARLLHAMSTNNIKDLATGEGLYAFFLTAQGRILADAYIYNTGESLFLDTEPEIAGKLREHLDKFIIADDANLDDETDQWAAIGLEGPRFREYAVSLGISIPEKPYSFVNWESGFVTAMAGTGPQGVRIFVPADQKDSLIQRLKASWKFRTQRPRKRGKYAWKTASRVTEKTSPNVTWCKRHCKFTLFTPTKVVI